MRLPNGLRLNLLTLPSLRRALWFLLPFCVATVTIGGVGGFERGKLLVATAGVILLMLTKLLEIVRTRTLRARSPWMHGLFGLSALLILIVFAFSQEHFASLFGSGGATSTTTLAMLFGLCAAWMLWMERDGLRTMMAVCTGWVMGVSIVALAQLFASPFFGSLSSFASASFPDSPNIMSPTIEQSGVLYAVTALLAFMLLLDSDQEARKHRVRTTLGLIGVLLSMVGLLSTNNTAGFITLTLCAIGALVGFWVIRATPSGVTVMLTVLSVIGVVLWVLPLMSWMGVSPGVDTTLAESTGWQIAARALSDSFWVGSGPETYQTAFLRFVPYGFYAAIGTQAWFIVGSSQIAHLLSTWGVVGTMAVVLMQVVPFVWIVRFFHRRPEVVRPQHVVLLIAALALVIAQFVLPLTMAGVALLWLLLGILMATRNFDLQETPDVQPSAPVVGAITGLGVITCAVVVVFSVMMIRAERVIQNYQQALTDQQSTEGLLESAALLKNMQPRSVTHGATWMSIQLLEISNGRVTVEEGTKEMIEFVQTLSLQFPKDPLLNVQLADALSQLRQFQSERAFDSNIANFYLTAMALSPEDPFLRVLFAQNIVARIQYDQSKERIPETEREDVRNALAQAMDLVVEAKVLLSAPDAFLELVQQLETLQTAFSGDSTPPTE